MRFPSSILCGLPSIGLILAPIHSQAAPERSPVYGQNFYKANGEPRKMVIFLFDGMTVQDFVGIYSMLNLAGGPDLEIEFVAKEKGILRDERGRLGIHADKSIAEVSKADIFVVPGGSHHKVIQDSEVLAWVKKMADASEYTASICTGSIILGAAGAITGKKAGVAWALRDQLAQYGVTYVQTPPPAQDGKYLSAAGAAGGIEMGLMLIEQITGRRALSEIAEFMAEWNPSMLYRSGDPEKAAPHVKANFTAWMKSDPIFQRP